MGGGQQTGGQPGDSQEGVDQNFCKENNLNSQQGQAESVFIRLGTGDPHDAKGSKLMASGIRWITHIHLQLLIYSVP